MAIRTLLFDLGNVLVRFSHERMCEQMGEVCRCAGAEIRRLLFDSGLQREFECGQLSEAEFHHRLEQELGRPIDIDKLRVAGSDIFELNEPLVPIIDALRRQGRRLVLLSNTSVTHFQWVKRRFDILERFDEFVVSFEIGAAKPEAAIYEAALDSIGCAPNECFYTDDIAAYVECGRRFGLQAEVFTDASALIKQLAERGVTLGG